MWSVRWRAVVRALVVVNLAAPLGLLLSGCNEDDVEKQLGRVSAASVEASYGLDKDPLMQEWLNHVGQTLVSHSARQDLPYEFRQVETGMVNAFAAPYGHIYLTQGLMDFVATEDEVWMITGHEIGHVVNRDSIKSFKRSLLWTVLQAIVTSKSETAGDIVGIGLGLLSLRYSRTDEYEADDQGTLLAYRAGYDPHLGLVFFDRLMTKLEKRRPASWEVYFMTHPPTEQRIARQMLRPELSEQDPEVLAQIGRGYLRRAQAAQALTLLQRAAQLKPASAELQMALGDAHALRGELQAARASYQAALEVSPGNSYARTQLAALADAQPWQSPGIGPDGQQQARELLAQLDQVRSESQTVQVGMTQYGAAIAGPLNSLREGVNSLNQRLLDLDDQQAELTSEQEQVVRRAASSVSKASDAAYELDSINHDFEELQTQIAEVIDRCRQVLQDAAGGRGDPAELTAVSAAVAELRRAATAVNAATSEAQANVELVKRAQSAAVDTMALLEQMVRLKQNRDLVAGQLRSSASYTSERAAEALKAMRQARRQSLRARGHALVARINLLGAGVGPYLETIMDRQVAHFLMCPAQQVRALRAEGAGYGRAAAAIAAARSLGGRPQDFLSREGKPVNPINQALAEGAAVDNINVLLKFLASAMQSERDAYEASEGQPQERGND